MKNYESRLTKIESTINQTLISDEDSFILVNVSAGETCDSKVAELEKKLGRKVNKNKLLFLVVSGLTRI